jgi:cytochrome c peroxidase
MARWEYTRVIPGVVSLLLSSAALAAGSEGNVPQRGSAELGEDLFFHETFSGNGRTCGTCHDPRAEFTISPELVRQRFATDPDHPLFRSVDSDDGDGRAYTTLLERAVFKVTVPLHPNVSLVDDTLRRTITVLRGVPSIANVDLTGPYLQDGRAATLQEQARGAIRNHMQPRHQPTAKELDALARFERDILYPLRLRSLRETGDPVAKAPGFSIPVQSEAARRGKATFDAHCRKCHDGELGDQPELPTTSRFASVFVSEANVPNFPMLRLAFKQADGTIVETITPDPGRAAITGDLNDLNAFDTPPLRGVKHTAPYFHDNSAASLDEVIEHYNGAFQFRIFGAAKDDLIAYLELL